MLTKSQITLGTAAIGSSILPGILTGNKIFSKQLITKLGYNTPDYWYCFESTYSADKIFTEVTKKLSFPMLAKKVTGTGSEGLIYIKNTTDLQNFIHNNIDVLRNGRYFFEQYINGFELSAGHITGLSEPLSVVEIKANLPSRFLSHTGTVDTKQIQNGIPARVSSNISNEIATIAQSLHSIFECNHISKTDFIYDPASNTVQVLEINVNPSLQETSVIGQLTSHIGLNNENLILHFGLPNRIQYPSIPVTYGIITGYLLKPPPSTKRHYNY